MTEDSHAARDSGSSCCGGIYELPLTQFVLGTSFHPGGDDLTRRLARAALVHPAARVLDVAAGRGAAASVLARQYGCAVTCVDRSPLNLGRARAAQRAASRSRPITHVVGDAEHLPFPDASFDVVFCECALCTFADGPRAADEMARVLVPRGRVALSDVTLERAIPPELETALGRIICVAGARTMQSYVGLLEDAGFLNVRAHEVNHAVTEIIDRVERGVARAQRLAEAGALSIDEGLTDLAALPPVLAAARDFARSGGLGYSLFTARVPG